jgi:hypothetical protein
MKTSTLSGLRRGTLLAMLLAVLAGVTVFSPTASAQVEPKKEEPLRPPQPGKPEDPPKVWNYIFLTLAVGLVGFAALIPSKRGHQD